MEFLLSVRKIIAVFHLVKEIGHLVGLKPDYVFVVDFRCFHKCGGILCYKTLSQIIFIHSSDGGQFS